MRINEDVLETVRGQLAGVSSSAASVAGARGAAGPSSLWTDAAAEGALAKAGAAAQAITRRAEAASREMAKAEQSLAAREESLLSPSVISRNKGGKGGGGGKGGKGGRFSNKDAANYRKTWKSNKLKWS